MANIVIVFESRYGQSHKIADHIVEHAHQHGDIARLVRVSLATHTRLDDADAFVVVAPVYFGRHARGMRRFLKNYRATLARRPLAFVSVSNSAAAIGTAAFGQAEALAQKTMRDVDLHPLVTVCAAGALAYPRYGFFLRRVMQRIAKAAHGPTDPTRIHELTSWERLDSDLAPLFTELADRDDALEVPSSRLWVRTELGRRGVEHRA